MWVKKLVLYTLLLIKGCEKKNLWFLENGHSKVEKTRKIQKTFNHNNYNNNILGQNCYFDAIFNMSCHV